MLVIAAGCKITVKQFFFLIVCIFVVFITESNGAPEQMDLSTQQKPSSDETDGQPDGEMQIFIQLSHEVSISQT